MLVAILYTTQLLSTQQESFTTKEILPSILSSSTEINLLQPITIKPDIPLYTPQLTNNQNCTVKNKECSHNNTIPKQIDNFTFQPTTNNTIEHTKRRKTFKKAHIPSLSIDRPSTILRFKAPKNKGGKRVQHIGAIEDSSSISTYIFHQGDYYIDSLHIESQTSNKNDRFTIKTKGKVRIFLNKDSYIIKRDDASKKRAYIELNYRKSASDLAIFSKGNLTIDASKRLKAHTIIYSYSNLTIISNKNSTIKGALYANGTLSIDKEIAIDNKQKGV